MLSSGKQITPARPQAGKTENVILLQMQKPIILIVSVILFACKGKKEKNDQEADVKLFPVVSFINSQVAHVDTSLYSIIGIRVTEEGPSDTVYHRREEFRELAKDFTELPDLTDSDYEDRYTKETIYDESMGRLIITMLPVEPAKEEIQRQEVVIRPDPSGDKVTSIIIDWVRNNRDSAIQKRMLWQVDESFQVTTIRQLIAQPETTSTYRVIWNQPEPEPEFPAEEKKELE